MLDNTDETPLFLVDDAGILKASTKQKEDHLLDYYVNDDKCKPKLADRIN